MTKMPAKIAEIMSQLVEHYGVGSIDELPFIERMWGVMVYDFDFIDTTARIALEDGDVRIVEFSGGIARIFKSQTVFSAQTSSKRIAAYVASVLDELLEAEGDV